MLITITSLLIANRDLFKDMKLPPEIDKETVVDNIVLECGELEILFADPDFMQTAIASWSKSMVDVWTALYNTYELDTQVPWDSNIEVYSNHSEGAKSDTRNSTSRTSGSDKTAHTVAGFNSEVLVDRDANTITYGASVTGNEENTANNSNDFNSTRDLTVKKNTAEVIKKTRENRRFNLYDVIVTDFKERFCLLVY